MTQFLATQQLDLDLRLKTSQKNELLLRMCAPVVFAVVMLKFSTKDFRLEA